MALRGSGLWGWVPLASAPVWARRCAILLKGDMLHTASLKPFGRSATQGSAQLRLPFQVGFCCLLSVQYLYLLIAPPVSSPLVRSLYCAASSCTGNIVLALSCGSQPASFFVRVKPTIHPSPEASRRQLRHQRAVISPASLRGSSDHLSTLSDYCAIAITDHGVLTSSPGNESRATTDAATNNASRRA